MKVFCVLSDHRAHKSKSPLMHNGVIRARGWQERYIYVPFQIDPENAGAAVAALRTLNIAGANVTVPCKEKVIPYLDRLSPEAAAVGAVNTINVEEDGSLTGYNTDIGGFLDALAYGGFAPAGRAVLLCGTGGAARGLLQALREGGAAKVWLAGRDPQKTGALAREFGAEAIDISAMRAQAGRAELIINATAVSTPGESPELAQTLAALEVSACRMVVDINYGRAENIWQGLARRAGAEFMDGFPMLAMQACRSFNIWTGEGVGGEEFLRALCG